VSWLSSAPSFYELARTAGTPEVLRLARTIKRWEPQVLSYFTTWRTNARSEAQNLVNEKLRRVAHGLRNFEHYRLRLCSTQACNETLGPLLESGAVTHGWSRRAG